MTTIIGLKHNGEIYMGGDSCIGIGDDYALLAGREKVIRDHVNGIMMGCAGNSRLAQLMIWHLNLPQDRDLPASGAEVDAYLHRVFVPRLQDMLREQKHLQGSATEAIIPDGGGVLVGMQGRLFFIAHDFSVNEYVGNFFAIGSGADYAMGAMAALRHLKPKERITQALEIASQFNNFTKPPFVVYAAPSRPAPDTALAERLAALIDGAPEPTIRQP